MFYGGSDDPPQGIGPRYLVDDAEADVPENRVPQGIPLRTRQFPKELPYYEPNAALLREPPDPSGKDTGLNPPYSDLVAEPVPVPLRSRASSPAGCWSGFATGLELVPKLSGPIWYGDGGLTTSTLPHFPPTQVPQGALVSKVSSKFLNGGFYYLNSEKFSEYFQKSLFKIK